MLSSLLLNHFTGFMLNNDLTASASFWPMVDNDVSFAAQLVTYYYLKRIVLEKKPLAHFTGSLGNTQYSTLGGLHCISDWAYQYIKPSYLILMISIYTKHW